MLDTLSLTGILAVGELSRSVGTAEPLPDLDPRAMCTVVPIVRCSTWLGWGLINWGCQVDLS